MRINTPEELAVKIRSCEACLAKKFSGEKGHKALLVCGGLGCISSGAAEIIDVLKSRIKDKGLSGKISVDSVGCFGFCSQGPFVRVYPGETLYRMVKPEDVERIIDEDVIGGRVVEDLIYIDPKTKLPARTEKEIDFFKKQTKIALHGSGIIDPENVEEAMGYGSFKALGKVLTTMTSQEVIDNILKSGLRGRGGGGFPTGRKWQFAFDQKSDVKYVVCNGDEGDPGAFMDRSILEANPFAVIEGMMIADYAIRSSAGYFYVRAEYPLAVARLKKAISLMEEIGLLGDNILGTGFNFRASVRLGAGAFVCGEETALLNSIEGQRGMPRPRPPFPAVKGLWQKPTIVNNVETLAVVPYIIRNGAEEFAKLGTEKSKGTKVFALGGKVNNVGLVEVPMGTTMRELIFDIGGGIPKGKKFKAIQTGGPSGGCLTEKDLDTPIDYDSLIARGSMMGSGGAIVMDEDNCMVDVAKFYMEFICDESCGKCSPCRIGTKRMLEYLQKITEGRASLKDLDDLVELAQAVKENSLCGLGQTAANPILSTLTNFRDEYIAHVVDKKCPAHVCKKLMEYYIVPEKCKKCGKCARVCPVSCISGELGKTPFVIDPLKCIKCGMCFSVCPFASIVKR